jgi:hypothetical protein
MLGKPRIIKKTASSCSHDRSCFLMIEVTLHRVTAPHISKVSSAGAGKPTHAWAALRMGGGAVNSNLHE